MKNIIIILLGLIVLTIICGFLIEKNQPNYSLGLGLGIGLAFWIGYFTRKINF